MEKILLAIETATQRGSVALLRGSKVLASRSIGSDFEHSKTLNPQIDELLKSQGIQIDDVNAVAVSQGPGSFTGLRVGIAFAKGMAMGLNIPLIAIPTFDVLFEGWRQDNSRINSCDHVALLIDAKKNEFFLQFRNKARGKWSAKPAIALPNEAVFPAMVAAKSFPTLLIGPQLEKLRKIMAETPQEGIASDEVCWDNKERFPEAADLATLGLEKWQREKRGDKDVKPYYLRKTDAEILFKNKPRTVFKWEKANGK
jgi:tRNA threonylcarbamoyladenosine biosynthesis protein TsaB